MTDEELAAEFESCRLPNELFRHRDHLQLAFFYLRRYGRDAARSRIQESILRYATANGAAHKYHVTITLVWMDLLEHAARRLPREATIVDLLEANPHLLTKTALEEYYSKELLASDTARTSFVEPDLKPLA